MKITAWILGGLALLIASFVIIERLAAERIEVVELHTVDDQGEALTTRLWVVDDAGFQYLRVGADGSGWFSRIQNNKTIELTRGGERNRFTTVLRKDKNERINNLMQAKYTWGDTFIAYVVGGRDGSVPIELHPIDP